MQVKIGDVLFTKKKSEYNDDWYDWLSDDQPIPYLDNKEIPIRLEFTDEELEQFKDEIASTIRNVLALNEIDRLKTKEHLFAYYKDFVLDVGEEYLDDMPPQENEENIFNYVYISELSISQSFETNEFYALFTGGCDWETEHGISISFKDGKTLARVGGVSHVCNSSAYADESKDKYIYYGNFIKTRA